MKLIAKQPCSFGGNKYYIGDEIPAEHVLDPRHHGYLGREDLFCTVLLCILATSS